MAARLGYRDVAIAKRNTDQALVAVANPVVTLYEPGTTTPLAATVYAARTGGTTLPNPFTGAPDGSFEFWIETAQPVKAIINGASAGAGTITRDYTSPTYEAGFVTLDGSGAKLAIVHTPSVGTAIQSVLTGGGGSVLALQSTPGSTVNIIQPGYTQAQVFGLAVIKSFHGTTTHNGSATATFNQVQYDATSVGSDATTAKMIHHWTGTNTTANATARTLEIEAIRYHASAGTGAATLIGATTAASMKYGSTRGIDIGLGHDPAITDAPVYITGLVGLNIFNVGAAGPDSKTWDGTTAGQRGNKATTGVVVWGGTSNAGGFNYGYVYNGPGMADQNLHTTTGRIWHVREAGGVDQMLLWSAHTTGTGIQLSNTSGTSFQRSLNVEGTGGSHPGALGIWNANDNRYMAAFWKSTTTSTIDQFLVGDGSAAVPTVGFLSDVDNGLFRIGANNWGLSAGGSTVINLTATQIGVTGGSDASPGVAGFADLNTGFVWDTGDVMGISIGGTRKVTLSATGFGIGITPANPLHVSGANAIRIETSSNWVAASGGTTATNPGITGGPTSAVASGWLKAINLGGTTIYIPYWI
jgi:hypothetical protein